MLWPPPQSESSASFGRIGFDGLVPCIRSTYHSQYLIEPLSVKALTFEIKQTTAKRLVTDFIVEPRVKCSYLMRVQFANVIDADMVLELLPCLSSLLKEVRPKPNLFQVRLMWILCQGLLYSYFSL